MEHLMHLPASYRGVLAQASALLGQPPDQTNLLIILATQAVAGALYRRLRVPLLRHLFGMCLGFAFIWGLYGTSETLALLAYVSAMYAVVRLVRRPWVVFWVSMGALVLTFAWMMYTYYLSWRLDVTTSLMGITIRLSTLAFDLDDGQKLRRKEPLAENARQQAFREEHACTRAITFFEYLSYMFFFVHALCGSNLQINEFLQLTDRKLFTNNGWRDRVNDPAPTWRQVLSATAQVGLVAIPYLVGQQLLPLSYLTTAAFRAHPFLARVPLAFLSCWLTKWKYHFGWKALDLSCITSGVAFSKAEYVDGDDKAPLIRWDRARNMNSIATAFPQNTAEVVNNWNMTVNKWLKHYVFFRVQPPAFLRKSVGDKSSKILLTRMASAVFHGTYPGYYVFFASSAVETMFLDAWRRVLPTSEELRAQGRVAASYLAWVFWFLLTCGVVDTTGALFMMLDVTASFGVLTSLYWWPHVLTAAGFALVPAFKALGVAKPKPARKKRE